MRVSVSFPFCQPRGVCLLDVPASWVVSWASLSPLVRGRVTRSEGAKVIEGPVALVASWWSLGALRRALGLG